MMIQLLKFRQTIFGFIILGSIGYIFEIFKEKGFWFGVLNIFITLIFAGILKYIIDLLLSPISLYLLKKNSFEGQLKEISKVGYKRTKENEISKSSFIYGNEYKSKE